VRGVAVRSWMVGYRQDARIKVTAVMDVLGTEGRLLDGSGRQ